MVSGHGLGIALLVVAWEPTLLEGHLDTATLGCALCTLNSEGMCNGAYGHRKLPLGCQGWRHRHDLEIVAELVSCFRAGGPVNAIPTRPPASGFSPHPHLPRAVCDQWLLTTPTLAQGCMCQ